MLIRSSRCCIFLAVTVVSLSISSCFGAVGFQPVSSDELNMTSDPKAPGAPAVILFREVDRNDDRIGATEDIYFRIKILTEEGRKYGDIEIPYWKNEIKITKIHARTIKPDGSTVDFDGKVFD